MSCVRRVLPAAVLLACSLGCASRSHEEFRAAPATARQALEVTLASWQNGAPAGPVSGGPTAIEAVDSRWKSGQKLERFEVLTEEPGEASLTVFSVRLKLKGAPREEVVRYVVVGRSPLWVYREDDYKGSSGM